MDKYNEKDNWQINFLKERMLNAAQSYTTPTFWRGKKTLLFDINEFSRKMKISIIDILFRLGVNEIGINGFKKCSDDENLYIGTLSTNEALYLAMACEDDGSSYKESVEYVM